MANKNYGFPVAVDPPAVSSQQWSWMALIGLVLIVMAVLQLISFEDFSGTLAAEDLSPPKLWAAVIVGAEFWAAASFFKLRLSPAFRAVSRFWAVLVALFWFIEPMRIWAQSSEAQVLLDGRYKQAGMGFFGKFLYQTPGWWPVVEASLFLIAVLTALEISRTRRAGSGRVEVTRKAR